jgi:hypothetical protein
VEDLCQGDLRHQEDLHHLKAPKVWCFPYKDLPCGDRPDEDLPCGDRPDGDLPCGDRLGSDQRVLRETRAEHFAHCRPKFGVSVTCAV